MTNYVSWYHQLKRHPPHMMIHRKYGLSKPNDRGGRKRGQRIIAATNRWYHATKTTFSVVICQDWVKIRWGNKICSHPISIKHGRKRLISIANTLKIIFPPPLRVWIQKKKKSFISVIFINFTFFSCFITLSWSCVL